MHTGTDVDYGSLTRLYLQHLTNAGKFNVVYGSRGINLRPEGKRWIVEVRNKKTGEHQLISAKFVFAGAGGGSLPLLQKSGIPEGKGYAGFPVSGIWLRSDNESLTSRHHAKVYGKAGVGAPPMSVPHLDTRSVM